MRNLYHGPHDLLPPVFMLLCSCLPCGFKASWNNKMCHKWRCMTPEVGFQKASQLLCSQLLCKGKLAIMPGGHLASLLIMLANSQTALSWQSWELHILHVDLLALVQHSGKSSSSPPWPSHKQPPQRSFSWALSETIGLSVLWESPLWILPAILLHSTRAHLCVCTHSIGY